MAYGSVGSLGSANSKVSGTTVVLTTSATAEAGNLVSVITAWDNTDTADGDTNRLSCTDSAGNTWTKIREYTTTDGVAADGVTLAIFLSRLANQLTSGGTITVTSDTARIAKASSAWEFTTTEAKFAVEQMNFAIGEGGTDPASLALTGMPSREYLILHAFGHETVNSVTVTYNNSYTPMSKDGTLGGSGAENMYVAGQFQIVTATSETVNIDTSSDSNEHLQLLVAIYEDATSPHGIVSSPFSFDRVAGEAPIVTAKSRVALPISFGVDLTYVGEITDNALHVTDAVEIIRKERSISLLDGSQAQIVLFSEAPEIVPDLTGAAVQLIPVTPAASVTLDAPTADARACVVRAWEINLTPGKRLFYRRDGGTMTNLGQGCEGFFLHGENRMVVQAALTNFVVIAEFGSNWYITCEFTNMGVT